MKILPSSDVECCDPDCATHGTTTSTGDLPADWTFRRVPGNDQESLVLLIYCPACSKAREAAVESLRKEAVTQAVVDSLSRMDADHDVIPMPVLDRQHIRHAAINRLFLADASLSLVVLSLKSLTPGLVGEVREIKSLIQELIRKLEDGDAESP